MELTHEQRPLSARLTGAILGSRRDGRIDCISLRTAQAGEHHRPGQGLRGPGASVCPATVLPTFGENMSPSVVLVARDRHAGDGCCHGYHDTPSVSAGRVPSADRVRISSGSDSEECTGDERERMCVDRLRGIRAQRRLGLWCRPSPRPCRPAELRAERPHESS